MGANIRVSRYLWKLPYAEPPPLSQNRLRRLQRVAVAGTNNSEQQGAKP